MSHILRIYLTLAQFCYISAGICGRFSVMEDEILFKVEGKQRFVVQREWRKPTKRLQIWNADKGKQNKINVGGLSDSTRSCTFPIFPIVP